MRHMPTELTPMLMKKIRIDSPFLSQLTEALQTPKTQGDIADHLSIAYSRYQKARLRQVSPSNIRTYRLAKGT